jgi:hypothetical protein
MTDSAATSARRMLANSQGSHSNPTSDADGHRVVATDPALAGVKGWCCGGPLL